jgi:hypothetical protein
MYVATLVVIGGIVGSSPVGAQTLPQAPPPAASPTSLIVEEDVTPYRTALGYHALESDFGTNAGVYNTGLGRYALSNNSVGSYNTAIGDWALTTNNLGRDNTATGVSALYYNTTGLDNTASGAGALQDNTTGSFNTATGAQALYSSQTGSFNTASGYQALYSGQTGGFNTASGAHALHSNTEGYENTASGGYALYSNTTGYANTASGAAALVSNTTGVYNTGVGFLAGDMALGSNNIFLGAWVRGTADDTNTMRLGLPYDGTNGQNQTFIAGIYGTALPPGSFVPVYINADGQLGTALASPTVNGGQPTGIGLNVLSQQLRDMQTTIADLRARLAELEARVGK